MIIKDPKASKGDAVRVVNRRVDRKLGGRWEPGTVHRITFGEFGRGGAMSWQYEVHLDRRSPSGKVIRVYAFDSQIELAPLYTLSR